MIFVKIYSWFVSKPSHSFDFLYRDKVVDFHWNASDAWTVVSVSDDCDSTGGGGTLQVSLSVNY